MSTADQIAGFTESDRLGLGVFSSVLLHMLLILGVTFTLPKLTDLSGLPDLEITLIQSQTKQAPDKADFLAQANQDGGGNSEEPLLAKNPLPISELSDNSSTTPIQRPTPQTQVASKKEVTTPMTTDQSDRKMTTFETTPKNKLQRNTLPNPGFLQRQYRATERAQLSAEISQFWQEYQQRPKRKFINARTREYKYAAYMDAWRSKVERIGNLNYPAKARRRGITGRLILDVELKPDGSVNNMTIRQSSGHKILDDAAIQIVTLSSPFAPFPSNISSETDILHITRTWKFNQNGLTSER